MSRQHLSISGISQLLLTRFWPNFKGRFLGLFWTDFNYCSNIFPGNICPVNICPYQENLSCHWLNFDQTLWTKILGTLIFFDQILFLDQKFCLTQIFFGSNIFWQKIFVQNVFWPYFFWQTFLWTQFFDKHFYSHNFFRKIILLDKKNLNQIFLWP